MIMADLHNITTKITVFNFISYINYYFIINSNKFYCEYLIFPLFGVYFVNT